MTQDTARGGFVASDGRTEALVIRIPGTPDARLSPNSRCHWRAKQGPKGQLENAAFYATIGALDEHMDFSVAVEGEITVRTTIYWEKGRKTMDADNALASMKFALDQVAQALGVNDKRFRHEPIVQTRDPDKRGFVEVIVEATA